MASDFSGHFRDHASPRLRRVSVMMAHAFVEDRCDFRAVVEMVMGEGIDCGSSFLTEAERATLENWVRTRAAADIETIQALQDEADALVKGWLKMPFPQARAELRDWLAGS